MTRNEVRALLARIISDPDYASRRAAREAARTDPWCWYCRRCGAEGADDSRVTRNEQAYEHTQACASGVGPRAGSSEAGRLLHVWTY